MVWGGDIEDLAICGAMNHVLCIGYPMGPSLGGLHLMNWNAEEAGEKQDEENSVGYVQRWNKRCGTSFDSKRGDIHGWR